MLEGGRERGAPLRHLLRGPDWRWWFIGWAAAGMAGFLVWRELAGAHPIVLEGSFSLSGIGIALCFPAVLLSYLGFRGRPGEEVERFEIPGLGRHPAALEVRIEEPPPFEGSLGHPEQFPQAQACGIEAEEPGDSEGELDDVDRA